MRCTAASVSGLTLDYYHHESFSQVTTSDNCDWAGLGCTEIYCQVNRQVICIEYVKTPFDDAMEACTLHDRP